MVLRSGFQSIFLLSLCLFGLTGLGCEKDSRKEVDNEKLEKFLANRPGLRPEVAEEPFVPPTTVEPYRIDDHTGGSLEPHRELVDVTRMTKNSKSTDQSLAAVRENGTDSPHDSTDELILLDDLQTQLSASTSISNSLNGEQSSPGIEGLEGSSSNMNNQVTEKTAASPSYQIDFTQNFTKSASEILDKMGFEVPSIFIKDIEPRFKIGSLVVGKGNSGFYGLRKKEITEISEEQKRAIGKLDLTWGVLSYPPGEDWNSKNKRRNSVGLMVSFGGKTSAGVPYFLGFLLTKTAKPFQYFKPTRYAEVGRYVTVGNPPEKTVMQTSIDLRKHFASAFGSNVPYPGVSGIAIEVDTRDMSGVGFIQKIQFFK